MQDLEQTDRPKVRRRTKVAAVIVMCAVATGAAAATGSIGTLMDWVSLTGFYESPDGSASGYLENGRMIDGKVDFQGIEYSVEDGHMVDDDGNVIGSFHVQSSSCCDEGECAPESCTDVK